MRTVITIRPLLVALGLLAMCEGRAQVTVATNNASSGDYVGCDNTSPFPLDIKQNDNQPIDWYTNAIQRIRLNPNLTGGLGQFGGINRDGFMLISGTADAFTNAGSRAPFTRLHLVDEAVNPTQPNVYAQQLGFRPWQRNGVTFTGNSDQGYVGQKYAGDDNTDLVVQWSDNPETQPWGCDRMKFVFSSTYIAGTLRGMNSYDGMEAMRFWPKSGTEVNVGIGDFAPPAIGDPTERLDILDGNVRIRALPDAGNQATGPFRYMVVDDSPLGNAQRGVVKWTTLPVDCKWNQFGGVNNNDLWTAVGAATDCPNYDNFVGVGTAAPWGKLHVKWTGPQGWQNTYGLFSELDGDATGKTAGHFYTSGAGDAHKGVVALTEGALTQNHYSGNYAVDARATANAEGFTASSRAVFAEAKVEPQNEVKFNWALDAKATVVASATVHNNLGVSGVANHFGTGSYNYGGYFESWAPNGVTNGYGLFSVAGGATNNWAGFFAGDVQATTYLPSDASLKSDIADAATSDMGDVLAQLSVHSYTYNTEMFPQMNLPQGQQVGFLAHEVEAVAPALVKDAVHPARFNADGEQVSEEVSYKAVNYTGLVPHLVSGHQSQGQQIQQLQEMVAAQGAQLAQMQEMLASCCAASPTDSDQRMLLESGGLLFGKDRALVIRPNPFSEPPTVLYALERAGRMQLIANSADGKQLSVLHEAAMEAGEYQLVWDTSSLQPGMYYLTLLLDGEPVVKKAVKVGR